MRILLIFGFYCLLYSAIGQTLTVNRKVDWTLAGLRDTSTIGFSIIDMQAKGVIGDGITANDAILTNVLANLTGVGNILIFPSGNFLFHQTINLPSNVIIRGQGATATTFTMSLGGNGNAFAIQGNSVLSDSCSITQLAVKDSNFIQVLNPIIFAVGDWIQIIQKDSALVTSSFALKTVGQISKIKTIVGNKIYLESPLRMTYLLSRKPYLITILPKKNIGIECINIIRTDNTAPVQTSTIYFFNAVNCWIKGVESKNCTFAHVKAAASSNLSISHSYFHHGFTYTDSGRAYGVMLEATTNECRVENNVFQHLRHSMILQSGANGNVFAFNYSFDPFWTGNTSNSAGDMVLHGNFPYCNLFEQNICQNIVIDKSHGANGPFNTFFRNRAESYGIIFSDSNSPSQNIIGNEIPNKTSPYNFVNYTIAGSGHFLFANNNKGIIDPFGTSNLPDSSYAYSKRPNFVLVNQWAKIGPPNTMNDYKIPAYDRFVSGKIFAGVCSYPSILSVNENPKMDAEITVSPNPSSSEISFKSQIPIKQIKIYDGFGQLIFEESVNDISFDLNIKNWSKGIYYVHFYTENENVISRKFIKI